MSCERINMNFYNDLAKQIETQFMDIPDRPSLPSENADTLEVPRGAALLGELSHTQAEDAIESVMNEPYGISGRSFVHAAVRAATRGDKDAATQILNDLADRAGETNFAQDAWLEAQRD